MATPNESFQKIELLRDKLGVPVSVMAKACGVSRPAYYGWLEGGTIRSTNFKRLTKVASVLVLLARQGDPPKNPLLTGRDSGERMYELIKSYM